MGGLLFKLGGRDRAQLKRPEMRNMTDSSEKASPLVDRGKIKIFYVYHSLNPGGAEELLLTTLKYLDKEVFEPYVCSMGAIGDIGVEAEKMGVKVMALGRRGNLADLGCTFSLWRAMAKTKPDIVHCHTFYANLHGRMAAKLARAHAIITTEHSMYRGLKRRRHIIADKLLHRFSDCVVCVSEAVKRHAMDQWRVPGDKFVVIPNAIDLERFEVPPLKAEARASFGLNPDDEVIGIVATITPWKGHDTLLEAFASIARHRPELRLLVIGGDPIGYRDFLERKVVRLGLPGRVIFAPESRQVAKGLAAMDIFVLPTLSEGFGISILEAMASGLPVVASNVGGVPEVITEGENGILFPPGDSQALAQSLGRLLGDHELARKLVGKAKERLLAQYAPEIYIERLQSLYRDILILKEGWLA